MDGIAGVGRMISAAWPDEKPWISTFSEPAQQAPKEAQSRPIHSAGEGRQVSIGSSILPTLARRLATSIQYRHALVECRANRRKESGQSLAETVAVVAPEKLSRAAG